MECKNCEGKFNPKNGNQVYCCEECRQEDYNKTRMEERRVYALKNRPVCPVCGKQFTRVNGNQKYCCEECKQKAANEKRSAYNKKRYRGTFVLPSITFGDEMDPYEALASAIVFNAVSDYRKKLVSLQWEPHNEKAMKEKMEIEKFILGNFFAEITDIEPVSLLKKLKAEVGE